MSWTSHLKESEELIMANRIIITGRLVADPELRQTQSGIFVTKFRIAVPRRFSKEEKTDFFDVEAWRAAAEFACKYFTKGKLIEIDGSLQTAPWEDKNNSKHQGVKIVAEQINFVGDKPKTDNGAAATVPSAPAMPEGFDPFAAAADNDDLPF